MQITGRMSRAMGLANDSIVLDEGDYEICGNNHNAQFPGCSAEQFKDSLFSSVCFYLTGIP